MHTVAICSQKGGVGKTTLAISLAVAAERDGKQAVIIDLDPQASACNWSDRREAETPITFDAQPSRLLNALEKAREGGIDLAVIDTPPRSEQSALAAAKAADLVLIPVRPSIYDLETIPNTLELLKLAGNPRTLVVLNAISPRGDRHQQAVTAVGSLGLTACSAMLTQRAAFGDAGALGLTATEMDPRGKAALETLAVYNEIMQILAKPEKRKSRNAESRPVKLAG